MFTRRVAVLMLLIGASIGVQAENLPDYYPSTYDVGGKLEAIHREDLVLTISDMQVHISGNTRVHTLREKNAYLGSLSAGQHVGVHFANPGSNQPVASDIWVLPNPQSLLPPPPGR